MAIKYTFEIGPITASRKLPPLGEVRELKTTTRDHAGKEMLPGSYRVVSVSRSLSTKLDDGSQVELGSFEVEEA